MSEQNSIYDIEDNLVGRFRHGVAWSSPNMERLGEYDDEFIFDNDRNMIAKFNDGQVLNIIGEEIGHISGNEIFVANSKVGRYIGLPVCGAAAVALIFNIVGTRGS